MKTITIKTKTLMAKEMMPKIFKEIEIKPVNDKIKILVDFLGVEYEFVTILYIYEKGNTLKGYFDVQSCVRKVDNATSNLELKSEFVQLFWNYIDAELSEKIRVYKLNNSHPIFC